ncbi:MAG: right-handed parallel beta-helix repeat-containing protein [Anaerolineaceae bacterium]|nr:right-handed parallel beta-helix repeat-containing protein [Anaerolineaceae bacterium]
MKKAIVLFLFSFILSLFIQTHAIIVPAQAENPHAPFGGSYRYVEPNGDGPFTTCPKDNPCNYYDAFTHATSGAWLVFKQGTYNVNAMGYTDPPCWHEVILLQNKSGTLIGGWDGDPTLGVETVIDPKSYETILDGEGNDRGITILGSPGYSWTISGFKFINGDATTAINTNCTALGASPTAFCGGGIYIHNADSVTLQSNTFTNNHASEDPATHGAGGAIFAYQTDNLNISENVIYANLANGNDGKGLGGAIFLHDCDGSSVIIEDNSIYDNNSAIGRTGYSSGILLASVDGAIVEGNLISNNNSLGLSTNMGTALYVQGSDVSIRNNQFLDNHSNSVIYIIRSAINLSGNLLNNPGANYGLWIYMGDSQGQTVAMNNIIANHIQNNVKIVGDMTERAFVAFYHTTIADDSNSHDGRGFSIGDYVDGFFTHGIVANQNHGFYNDGHANGTITIEYHLMHDNTSDYDTFSAMNSFSGDPQFVNAINSSTANFHIRANSAARDKGPGYGGLNVDIDGQLRPNPLHGMLIACDLGADEFWGWFLPLIFR